jgi:hypothetical protein
VSASVGAARPKISPPGEAVDAVFEVVSVQQQNIPVTPGDKQPILVGELDVADAVEDFALDVGTDIIQIFSG